MRYVFLTIGLLLFPAISFTLDYSFGDNLETVRKKNPGVTLNDTGTYPGHQFKAIEGQFITTTETTITFDLEMRLFQVVMRKNGAAFDVYTPLVEQYTEIYGKPKEENPLRNNLNTGVAAASCSWESDKGSATLLLVIPLNGSSVPWILLSESRDVKGFTSSAAR